MVVCSIKLHIHHEVHKEHKENHKYFLFLVLFFTTPFVNFASFVVKMLF